MRRRERYLKKTNAYRRRGRLGRAFCLSKIGYALDCSTNWIESKSSVNRPCAASRRRGLLFVDRAGRLSCCAPCPHKQQCWLRAANPGQQLGLLFHKQLLGRLLLHSDQQPLLLDPRLALLHPDRRHLDRHLVSCSSRRRSWLLMCRPPCCVLASWRGLPSERFTKL
mgnify:CR=1 FL=1